MGKVGVRVKLATHFYLIDRILGNWEAYGRKTFARRDLEKDEKNPNPACFWAEIRILNIPSTKQECYDSTPRSDLPSSGKF
jgi:hypothetical protein